MSKRRSEKNAFLKGRKLSSVFAATLSVAPMLPAMGTTQAATIGPLNPIDDIIGVPGDSVQINLQDVFGGSYGSFSILGTSGASDIAVPEQIGSYLKLQLAQPGRATFTVTALNSVGVSVTDQFHVNVMDKGSDGRLDIGDVVSYMHNNPEAITSAEQISGTLHSIGYSNLPVNHKPTVTTSVYELYVNGDTISQSVPLSIFHFQDQDAGDFLTYKISPSSANSLHASVNSTHVSITSLNDPLSAHETSFAIEATDIRGASAAAILILKKNHAPVPTVTGVTYNVYAPLAPLSFSLSLNVNDLFTDSDHDSLVFDVSPKSMTNGVTAAVYGGTRLDLSGIMTDVTTFEVTASDRKGGITPLFLTLDPNSTSPNNRRPVAAYPFHSVMYKPDHYFYSESYNLPAMFGFTDADGDSLAYSVDFDHSYIPTNLQLSIEGHNLVLDGEFHPATLIINAVDGKGGAAAGTLALQELPNHIPTVTQNTYTSFFNSGDRPFDIILSSNFSDLDNDSLSYTVSPSASGGLTPSITGSTLSFQGQLTSDALFHVTASDGRGGSISAVYKFLVNHGAPISVSITDYNVGPRTFKVEENFTDSESQPVSYALQSASSNQGLTSSLNGSILTVSGNPNSVGPIKFTVRVTDSLGFYTDVIYSFAIGPKVVTVTQSAYAHIYPDHTVGYPFFMLSDNFLSTTSNPSLTYEVTPSELNGIKPHIYGNSLTFTSTSSEVPTLDSTFVVTATDSNNNSISADYAIRLNHSPDLTEEGADLYYTGDSVNIAHNLSADFVDPEEDLLTYSINEEESEFFGLSVSNVGSYLVISGEIDSPGSIEGPAHIPYIAVKATDIHGGMVTKLYYVKHNHPVEINQEISDSLYYIDNYSNPMIASINLNHFFSDYDDGNLEYSFDSAALPSQLSASLDGGILSINKKNALEPYSVEFNLGIKADDGKGGQANRTLMFKPNHAPIADKPSDYFQLNAGAIEGSIHVDLQAKFGVHDSDGDGLTYSIASFSPALPDGLNTSTNGVNLVLSGIVPEDFTGAPVYIEINDGHGGSNLVTLILAKNQSPYVDNTSISENYNGAPHTFKLADNFIDEQPLNFTLDGPASSLGMTASISVVENVYYLTISDTPNSAGYAQFKVKATDSLGLSSTAVYKIYQGPVAKSSPHVVNVGQSQEELSPVYVRDLFNDPSGELLTYTLLKTDIEGVAESNGVSAWIGEDDQLYFSGFPGADPASFEIAAADSFNHSVQRTVEIRLVGPTSNFPNIEGFIQVHGEMSFMPSFHLTHNFNGTDLIYTVSPDSEQNGLTPSITGGMLTFTSTSIPTESTSFTVTATQNVYGNNYSASAEYTVAVNHAPDVSKPVQYLYYNSGSAVPSQTIDFTTLFQDVDEGDQLTFELLPSSYYGNGNLSVDWDTNHQVAAISGEISDTAQLHAAAKDGKGGMNVVNIVITPNTPPYPADYSPVATYSGAVIDFDLGSNFSDFQNHTITYFIEADENAPQLGLHAEIIGDHLIVSGTPTAAGTLYVKVKAVDSMGASSYAVYYRIDVPNNLPVAGTSVTELVYRPDVADIPSVDVSGLFTDADAHQTMTYSLSSSTSADGVTAALSGSTLSFSGVPGYSTDFIVRATDSLGGFAETTVRLKYAGPKRWTADVKGVANILPDNTVQFPTFYLNGNFYSTNAQPISSYEVLPAATTNGITPVLSGSTLTFTGTPEATTNFIVKATDSDGIPISAVYELVPNHMPRADKSSDYFHLNAGAIEGTIDVDLQAKFGVHDSDGDGLTYSIASFSPALPDGLNASTNGVNLVFSGIVPEDFTSAPVYIEINDGHGGSILVVVTIAKNQSPYAFNSSISVTDYSVGPRTFKIDENFIDAQPISYALQSASSNQGLTASVNGSTLTISGNPSSVGTIKFTVRATDSLGLYTDVDYLFTIDNANPQSNEEIHVIEYMPTQTGVQPYDLNGLFTDPDSGQILTYSIVSDITSDNVTASIHHDDGTINFTGKPSLYAQFTVRATDPLGGYKDAIVKVKYKGPKAVTVTQSAYANIYPASLSMEDRVDYPFFMLSDNFLSTNPADQSMTYRVTPETLNGITATIDGDSLTFTSVSTEDLPTENTTFVVTATDIDNISISANYEIRLNNVPGFTDSGDTLYYSGDSVNIHYDLSADFLDIENDPLTYSISEENSNFYGLNVSLVGSNLILNGEIDPPSYSEDPENVPFIVVDATDSKGGELIRKEFYVKYNHPVEINSETSSNLYYVDVSDDSRLKSVDLYGYFFDYDNEGLEYSFDPATLPSQLSASMDGDILYIDKKNREEPYNGIFSLDVKAEDGRDGYAVRTLTFKPNHAPISSSINTYYVQSDFDWSHINLSTLFTDQDEGDMLSFDAKIEHYSGTSSYYSEPVDANQPFTTVGTYEVNVTASDTRGSSITKSLQFNDYGVNAEPSTKTMVQGSILTLKDLYARYGTAEIASSSMQFTISSSEPNLVKAAMSGPDLVLEAAALTTGTATISIVGTDLTTGKGIYDQFTVNVSEAITAIENQISLSQPSYDGEDYYSSGLTFMVDSESVYGYYDSSTLYADVSGVAPTMLTITTGESQSQVKTIYEVPYFTQPNDKMMLVGSTLELYNNYERYNNPQHLTSYATISNVSVSSEAISAFVDSSGKGLVIDAYSATYEAPAVVTFTISDTETEYSITDHINITVGYSTTNDDYPNSYFVPNSFSDNETDIVSDLNQYFQYNLSASDDDYLAFTMPDEANTPNGTVSFTGFKNDTTDTKYIATKYKIPYPLPEPLQ